MDIDLDFADRDRALTLFKHIPASRLSNDQLVKHNTGVYMHAVPVCAATGVCNEPFDQAEQLGYFKLDFLNVSVYKGIKNNQHLDRLISQEPLWDLLLEEEFVDLLFHLNGHADILKKTKPTSIEQLAAVLAMIRPAKRHLIDRGWENIMQEVWVKPENGEYYFKHAHAIAYATLIVVQMNLICEGAVT